MTRDQRSAQTNLHTRRSFLGCAASVLILVSLAPNAQTPGQVRRIGYLVLDDPWRAAQVEQASAALRELGWNEGQNLLLQRSYAGSLDQLRALAHELVELKVEVIVTESTAAARTANSATNTIPIVMWSVGDPVKAGLVASLARPGGNITGFSVVNPELDAKSISLLRELVPAVQRVGVLLYSNNP